MRKGSTSFCHKPLPRSWRRASQQRRHAQARYREPPPQPLAGSGLASVPGLIRLWSARMADRSGCRLNPACDNGYALTSCPCRFDASRVAPRTIPSAVDGRPGCPGRPGASRGRRSGDLEASSFHHSGRHGKAAGHPWLPRLASETAQA